MNDLEEYVENGGGMSDKKGMLKAILKYENDYNGLLTSKEEYLLACAYRNYACWHCHAIDEEPYVKQAVRHFEIAYNESETVIKVTSGSDLVHLLVNNIRVRDYDKAEKIAKELFRLTAGYLPCFCDYLTLLYRQKRYDEALKVLMDCKYRVANDDAWGGMEIPFLNNMLGKLLKKVSIKD